MINLGQAYNYVRYSDYMRRPAPERKIWTSKEYFSPEFQNRDRYATHNRGGEFEDAYNTALDPQTEGGTPPATPPPRIPQPTPTPRGPAYLKDGKWVHERGGGNGDIRPPGTGGIKPPMGWAPGKLPMYGPWNGRGWRL